MGDGGDNTGRDNQGRFTAGNPGGPGGPRRRTSELRRAAEEAITPDHVAAMVRKATRMGLEGDLSAMRLVFERTCGRAAEAPVDAEPVGVALPRLRTAEDCNTAIQLLSWYHDVLAGIRLLVPGFETDAGMATDIAMLEEYSALLSSDAPAQVAEAAHLSDSMRYAARLKVLPAPTD